MTHRGYRNVAAEMDLRRFRGFDRAPAHRLHVQRCACGVETSRSVQGIGWECKNCGEARLVAQFQKAVHK